MFLRRRGCLFGCGSFLIICVLASLLGWFVVIPRVTDALEASVNDGFATVIADQIDPLYSRSELQGGQDVRLPFDTINANLQESTRDEQVDSVTLTTEGDRLVVRAQFNGQSYEIEFIPEVTSDGRLNLEPVDEGSWFQGVVMDVLGGGTEGAINEWLATNNLRLTDVTLDGDAMILTVEGE